MSELGLSTMERLIKKAGAKRVSKEASLELGALLERIAQDLSKDATTLANHAGRKTILADDVKLAAKQKNL